MSDLIKAMDPGDLESMAAEVERLRARNAELVAALREYGMHKQDCERNETYGSEPCDCGYDAAIAKAGGKE